MNMSSRQSEGDLDSKSTQDIVGRSRNNSKTDEEAGLFEKFNQENMYNAFQSKLFVDDCDLNVKIKALTDI